MLAATVLCAFAGPAGAATVPFNPAQPVVFVAQGGPTQLESAQQVNGSISFTPVGTPTAGVTYNAIAYDTCDNFIYAVQSTTANGGTPGSIIRIATDGSISYTGINVGSGFNVGAFGPGPNCDQLYVGQSGTSSLDVVNLTSGTFTTIGVGSKGPDMTYNSGYFWSMSGANQIQRISVTPGQLGTTLFTVSTPAVNGKSPGGTFGAAWTYGNGNLGFSDNATGNIYQLSIANGGAAQPTFTTVLGQAGPASSNNDGSNAPGLSTDLALTKTASPTMADPGATITYTLKVTNSGPGNSSGYALNDTLPAGLTNVATSAPGCQITGLKLSCAGNPLTPGSSETRTITAKAPNPFPSTLTNTATVTANEMDTNPSNNTGSATVEPNVVTVSLVKTAGVRPAADQNAADVGDAIRYSYKVTNTGNVPLPSVAVDDPTAGSVTCPVPASPGLAVGAAETCVADAAYTVSQADVDAGSVTDVATATGTDATGFTSAPSAPATATVPTVTAAPALSMRKVADASLGDLTPVAVGETVRYSYVLTNTGNVDLGSLGVSDPTAGATTCPAPGGLGLAPGQSETCSANALYTVTQADVDNGRVTDTATGSGTDAQGQTVTSQASSILFPSPPAPQVSINKSATVSPAADQTAVQVGDTIQYSYRVTNIGNVTLRSVTVSDPTGGAVSCPTPAAPGLAPGGSVNCTADTPYTVAQADIDAGSVTDLATAAGTDTSGNTSPSSDPSSVSIPAVSPAPSVSIAKSAAVSPAADQTAVQVGDTIQYSYRVTNTGNVTLQSVAVSDPTSGGASCPTPPAPGLAPGASEVCTNDIPDTVAQSDVDTGSVTDTATATGVDTQGVQSSQSDASQVTVPAVAPAPAVSIDKSATVSPAEDQAAVAVGDRIQYSYRVTNTGNVTLASVTVTDPTAGGVTCPAPAVPGLAPGASESCASTSPHVVTQTDVDAGRVTDAATARGTDTRGNLGPPSAPSRVTVPAVDAQPAVSMIKTGSAANGNLTPITTGEAIAYSYLVTNTGNVDLTRIAVSDDRIASVTCPTPAAPGLAPGQSESCTATYSVTAADANNNDVTNTATATGTDTQGATSPPSAPSSTDLPADTPSAAVAITKSAVVTPASQQTAVRIGDHISYSYKVTNIGNVNLSSTSVEDPTAGSVTCPALAPDSLAPGASVTCTADVPYEVTQDDIDSGAVLDTATATGSGTVRGAPIVSPESDPSNVLIPTYSRPAVLLAKTPTVSPEADQDGVNVGDTIQYGYLVTNVGNVTLTSVAVSDPSAGTIDCPTPATPGLAPGSSERCTAQSTVTVAQADVDRGHVDDTATATGVDTQGTTTPVASGSATVPAVVAVPTVSVAKHAAVAPSADQSDVKVGDTVDYDYTVTNTGNVTLQTITVSDPELGTVSCPTPPPPGLAPGDSETCTADESHSVIQDDIDNGGVTDRATANGADTNGNLTPIARGSITVPAIQTPRLSLAKTATVSPTADQNALSVGDSVAYRFLVTNTGNVDLAAISVSDPALGPVACPVAPDPGLAPGASETCTGEIAHIVDAADRTRGELTNTATAQGTDGSGDSTPPASASVTLTFPATPIPPSPSPPGPSPPPAPSPAPHQTPKPATPATELVVHKHVDRATAYPGQHLTYTLTVHNNGPDAAAGVTITDAPSLPLRVISVSAGHHRCRVGRTVTCALGTIPAGRSDKILIVAVARRAGTERNTAAARSRTRLLNARRARSSVITRISPILRLRKRALQRSARTGQNVTYRITVSNPTIAAIDHVGVCDRLPAGLGFLRATPHASLRTGDPCWSIPHLSAHRSRTLTVVVNVEPGTAGRVVNTAQASAAGVRPVIAGAHILVTATPKSPCTLPSVITGADTAQSTGRGPIARPAC